MSTVWNIFQYPVGIYFTSLRARVIALRYEIFRRFFAYSIDGAAIALKAVAKNKDVGGEPT